MHKFIILYSLYNLSYKLYSKSFYTFLSFTSCTDHLLLGKSNYFDLNLLKILHISFFLLCLGLACFFSQMNE